MIRLNSLIHKSLQQLAPGVLSLSFTKHALAQASEREIVLYRSLDIQAGQVVELETNDEGVPAKIVVRRPSPFHVDYDEVFVLALTAGERVARVVTCWLNRVDDKHATLKLDRINR